MEVEFSGTDRFELLSRLGEGGMGVVYEARDLSQDCNVALKILRGRDPEQMLRFKREFRSLQDLEHENLVNLFELIADGAQWFFTMELIRGKDLRSYVLQSGERGPTVDEARLRSCLLQLADGVSALHGANKVHRDLKPSNVLVTPEGRLVLLDFGLVADMNRDTTHRSEVVGTTAYMAPEQGAAQPSGPAADWYSVGVILYELLTGDLPFDGSPLRVLMDKQVIDPCAPSRLNPATPPDLDELCLRLLARPPGDRANGVDILRALGAQGPVLARLSSSPASGIARPGFFGRDDELAEIAERAEATQDGATTAIIVRGESGVGKSALVRRFADRMLRDHADGLVLSGRCYERETLPYKALDGVVDDLSQFLTRLPAADAVSLVPKDAALLAQVFPVLRRVESIARSPRGPRTPPSPREVRNRAFGALRQLLGRLARQRRVLLFIDDLQWADADSLALLAELLQPPDAPRLCLIATVRDDLRDSTREAALPLPTHSIHLRGLPPDQAIALAASLGQRAGLPDPALAVAIAAEAEGHPLFIYELMRHLEVCGERAPAAVKLDDALWHRIERLEPPARKVLEVLAVAGAPIAHRVAARASELDLREYHRWVGLLHVGHLARGKGAREHDRVVVYHDRVREAVVARLDGSALQFLHSRLAIALEAAGAADLDPQSLVRHLDAAGEYERAGELAEAAADRSRAMLAFERAAELYDTAVRLGRHDPSEARALHIKRGRALVEAGRGREAAAVFLAAAEGADLATRLDCQKNAALQLLLLGHIEQGLHTLRGVLADLGLTLAPTTRRAIVNLLARQLTLKVRGLGWKARDASQIPAADLARMDVYQDVARALSMVDHVRGAEFQSKFMLAALRAGEPARVSQALSMQAAHWAASSEKRVAAGRRLLARAREIADELADPRLVATTESIDGVIEYVCGNPERAYEVLTQAEGALRDHTVGSWELQTVRTFRVWSLRHLGRARAMRELLFEFRRAADRLGDRYAVTTMVRTGICAWLDQDLVDEAMAELDATSWEPPSGAYHMQHWYHLKARCEIELYARRGDLTSQSVQEGFDRHRQSRLTRLTTGRVEMEWMAGRLALVEAERAKDPRSALARAERAARSHARLSLPYARIFSQMVLGGVAHLRGDDSRAEAHLERAIEVATQYSMRAYAAAARRCLGSLVGGRRGERLIERADSTLAKAGVANPARLAGMYCPGFARAE